MIFKMIFLFTRKEVVVQHMVPIVTLLPSPINPSFYQCRRLYLRLGGAIWCTSSIVLLCPGCCSPAFQLSIHNDNVSSYTSVHHTVTYRILQVHAPSLLPRCFIRMRQHSHITRQPHSKILN